MKEDVAAAAAAVDAMTVGDGGYCAPVCRGISVGSSMNLVVDV